MVCVECMPPIPIEPVGSIIYITCPTKDVTLGWFYGRLRSGFVLAQSLGDRRVIAAGAVNPRHDKQLVKGCWCHRA
jgi:hypothetical protein